MDSGASVHTFKDGAEIGSGTAFSLGVPELVSRRIFIDAGHGGQEDVGRSRAYGARGARGTLEKDVTLDIARRVAVRLGGGARLTRAGDENLALGARAEQAAREGADVFVSIHANGGVPERQGPETGPGSASPSCKRSLDAGVKLTRMWDWTYSVHATSCVATGRVSLNSAPRGELGSADRCPPWASTMERLMASPMPMPWGLVV